MYLVLYAMEVRIYFTSIEYLTGSAGGSEFSCALVIPRGVENIDPFFYACIDSF